MAKKTEHPVSQNGLADGEISTIRNILMGAQMSDYEKRFNQLDERLNQLEMNLQSQLETMRLQTNDRSQEMNRDFGSRMDRLEKLLETGIHALDQKLEKVTRDDKKKLGKMMAELSAKLIGE